MDDTQMFPNRETLMHARLHFDGAYDYLLGGGTLVPFAMRSLLVALLRRCLSPSIGAVLGAGISSGIPPTGCGDAHLDSSHGHLHK